MVELGDCIQIDKNICKVIRVESKLIQVVDLDGKTTFQDSEKITKVFPNLSINSKTALCNLKNKGVQYIYSFSKSSILKLQGNYTFSNSRGSIVYHFSDEYCDYIPLPTKVRDVSQVQYDLEENSAELFTTYSSGVRIEKYPIKEFIIRFLININLVNNESKLQRKETSGLSGEFGKGGGLRGRIHKVAISISQIGNATAIKGY